MGCYGKKVNGKEIVTVRKVKEILWSERKPLYTLANCKKCNASQADKQVYSAYFSFREGADGWKVICKNCGNQSLNFFAEELEAVEDWNGKKNE